MIIKIKIIEFKCSFLEHNKSSSLINIFNVNNENYIVNEENGKNFIKELSNASFIRKQVKINEDKK